MIVATKGMLRKNGIKIPADVEMKEVTPTRKFRLGSGGSPDGTLGTYKV